MTVTGITEISKSKVKIMIDYEFAFVLYKGELCSYHIKEGQEITQETYDTLMKDVLAKRAKLRAMHLLKARSYTEKTLTDKLTEGGYPDEVIEIAVTYVKSFGYIDDRQYAIDFIEYNKESKSRSQIVNALISKGITGEIIEESWHCVMAGEERNLETEQILTWMKKKKFNPAEADFGEKQKFSAFLYRKGFQIDNIRDALSLDITSI